MRSKANGKLGQWRRRKGPSNRKQRKKVVMQPLEKLFDDSYDRYVISQNEQESHSCSQERYSSRLKRGSPLGKRSEAVY